MRRSRVLTLSHQMSAVLFREVANMSQRNFKNPPSADFRPTLLNALAQIMLVGYSLCTVS